MAINAFMTSYLANFASHHARDRHFGLFARKRIAPAWLKSRKVVDSLLLLLLLLFVGLFVGLFFQYRLMQ